MVVEVITAKVIEKVLLQVTLKLLEETGNENLSKGLKTAYTIYSTFSFIENVSNCILATCDCDELGIHGKVIIIEDITEKVISILVNNQAQKLIVRRTKNGYYLDSDLVQPIHIKSLKDKKITLSRWIGLDSLKVIKITSLKSKKIK